MASYALLQHPGHCFICNPQNSDQLSSLSHFRLARKPLFSSIRSRESKVQSSNASVAAPPFPLFQPPQIDESPSKMKNAVGQVGNEGDSFVDGATHLTFHPTSSTSTATVSLPPKPPPPPRRRLDEDKDDENDNDFKEKALFLDSIGIDSLSVLSRDPSVLASTSLPELKLLCEYLSSLGLSPADLRRIASMCPAVLSLRLREAASVCSFLIREARVRPSDLRRVLNRRPRLLLSPVSSRLRPSLYFLQSIGIHDVTRHTDLLSCSVEDKFLPRIDYLQKLGFSYRDTISMFRRFPPLFCYSLQHNFEPKFNYFVVEICRELKELREFPQYFSFSLDKRIKPRHQMCIRKGVYFPLNVMLKTTEHEFQRRLGACVDSSLPVRDSPLWCTNQCCDVNTTTNYIATG